jgi:hypothetical protein
MGKRFAILIAAAALVAAVIAAGASADFRSVDDPRGDTTCVHEFGDKPCSDWMRRNADIVRVTAGHEGARLRHTIRVVGRFQSAALWLNTDSDRACDLSLFVGRRGWSAVQELPGGRVTGRARVVLHRHSVEILFSERSIGSPQSYGWGLFINVGDWQAAAHDHLPGGCDSFQHGLG